VPYANCESEALLVVQVTVAPDEVMADTLVSETVSGAISERVVVLEVPFRLAVIVAVWSEASAPAVAVNVAELELAGTLMEAGTVNPVTALLKSATAVLPADGFDRATVQVVLALETRLAAAHCSEDMVESVVREIVAVCDELFNVAVTVAF